MPRPFPLPARLAAALALGVLLAAPAQAADELRIVNRLGFDIHALFVSPPKVRDWGPDELSEEVLEAGKTFRLRTVPAGRYDVKLFDESGIECVLENAELAVARPFTVTPSAVENCPGFGK